MVLILALALLIALAFTSTNNAIRKLEDKFQQLQSLKTIDTDRLLEQLAGKLPISQNGKDGINGRDGQNGVDGKNGKDGEVDYELIADYIKQTFESMPKPKNGLDGKSARQIEFDGQGHWRYLGDDEWLPLFQEEK